MNDYQNGQPTTWIKPREQNGGVPVNIQDQTKTVVVDVIGVDRPIDHLFPSATTLGRIVTTEMAVSGSLVSPQIYSLRSGSVAT